MVAVAHANDWAGSIRIPASACGVVGLKPSRGRTSLGPAFGEIVAGFTAENVVCRSVRDVAAVLDAIAGPMPGDPYTAPPPQRPWSEEVGAPAGRLRIGLLKRLPYLEVHHECVRAVDDAGCLLEALGHDVEESYPDALDALDVFGPARAVLFARAARMIDAWGQRIHRPIRESDLEPWTRTFTEYGRSRTLVQYLEAQDQLQRFTRRVASWWASGFDLLVSPTLATVPPRIGFFDAAAADLVETLKLHALGVPLEAFERLANRAAEHWGTGVSLGAFARSISPSAAAETGGRRPSADDHTRGSTLGRPVSDVAPQGLEPHEASLRSYSMSPEVAVRSTRSVLASGSPRRAPCPRAP